MSKIYTNAISCLAVPLIASAGDKIELLITRPFPGTLSFQLFWQNKLLVNYAYLEFKKKHLNIEDKFNCLIFKFLEISIFLFDLLLLWL